MLIDDAELILKAGHGGPGKVSFYPPPQKGPDGGNGGKGGNICLKVTSDLTALKKFTTIRTLKAKDGQPGGSNRKFGKDGQDLEILIPTGTLIKDLASGEEIEFNSVGERFLIAKGGLGGKGNFEFKSPKNTTPKFAQPGLAGGEKHLQITLKLIADLGLIGLPNAGKSSLLNELTNASAKVAPYPFTTLEPNLGVLNSKIIADIPGLIEGASLGKGLGIKFLRHIEKVNLLLHCISSESEDVLSDYQIIRKELGQFNPELLQKPELILLTKSDLVEEEKLKNQIKKLAQTKKKVIPISIHDWDSLEKLRNLLYLSPQSL